MATEQDSSKQAGGEEATWSRRRFLGAGAAGVGAFFIAHATGDFRVLEEAAARGMLPPARSTGVTSAQDAEFNDEPFDPEAVQDGSAGWFPSRYGEGDELGAYNEITPQKILRALSIIKPNPAFPPKVYNLGEILEEGVPAFGDRTYTQQRVGPAPGPGAGDNRVRGMEERYQTTYHIATQVDGLPHIGVGNRWYNGFTGEELTDGNPSGVNHLGQELVPPIITRGLLLDVLSVKMAQGASDALDEFNGHPILADSYRITVEDLKDAMAFGGILSIEPGDVVVTRTGWSHLVVLNDQATRDRYVSVEPGIYLREARWLAQFRPAIVGSDTPALEVLPAPDPWSTSQFFPVHQELLTHHGIRIGEAFNCEGLAEDGVYEFVFFNTPQRPRGGTASNNAPGALGQRIP